MGRAPSPIPLSVRQTPEYRRQNWQGLWWHDAIADAMLAHPEWTKQEVAKSLGVSATTIYMVTSSDAFKARWSQRRQQYTEAYDGALQSDMMKVAHQSLGLMSRIMEERQTAIPLPILNDIADKTLSRLGYGVKSPAGVQVNVNAPGGNTQVVVPVTASDLEEARRALRRSEAHLRGEVQALPSPGEESPSNYSPIEGEIFPPESKSFIKGVPPGLTQDEAGEDSSPAESSPTTNGGDA